MAIKLLSPGDIGDSVAFYQHWFAEAWEAAGGIVVSNSTIWPHAARVVLGRNWPGFNFSRKNKLLVLGSGRVESVSWPQLLIHEIVPFLWDVWPDKIAPLIRFVRRNKIRTLFCTSSQVVEILKSRLSEVDIHWIPEGIKVEAYPKGENLKNRPVDILSYGRQMTSVTDKLRDLALSEKLNVLFREGDAHLFSTFDDLVNGLQSSKLTICYPQSVTHPERAKNTETLTQRYWEAMLTGTLLIGQAPKELIEVCGYNPVVELDDNPTIVVNEILKNIEKYQSLVDRNRGCAEEKADWSMQISKVMELLK
jgi:hypothetical protein